MKKLKNYRYYVEGDDEKRLLDVLKKDLGYIQSGKVEKFNATQKLFTAAHVRTFKQHTVIILVYDIDAGGDNKKRVKNEL